MFSEKQLRAAAAELNKVCSLDPPIDTKGTIEDLSKDIQEVINAEDPIIQEGDKFSTTTQAVLDELGEGKGEEDNPLKDDIEAAETRSDLVEIVKANDEFKEIKSKLSSYKTSKDLKIAMLDILSVEADEQQETAEEIHERNVGSKPVRTSSKEGAAPSKVTKERFAPKKSTGAERVDFLTPLIASGKHTKADLVEMASKEFPDVSVSTLQTMLTDAKNPKYNKFKKLVVQNEDGVMSFKR
jgi:uncharacterized membrane protein YgaE (UPF0421/DUF939 family)